MLVKIIDIHPSDMWYKRRDLLIGETFEGHSPGRSLQEGFSVFFGNQLTGTSPTGDFKSRFFTAVKIEVLAILFLLLSAGAFAGENRNADLDKFIEAISPCLLECRAFLESLEKSGVEVDVVDEECSHCPSGASANIMITAPDGWSAKQRHDLQGIGYAFAYALRDCTHGVEDFKVFVRAKQGKNIMPLSLFLYTSLLDDITIAY